ncbi:uncharacterized protein LOC114548693 isoform X2 [Perca flavescens]|nr:uncharacterized protein LOC114548693 isoform X2 [Perca flavescens]
MCISVLKQHVEGRRDAIIRCLMENLGESGEELIKDYQDVSEEAIGEEYNGHVMKIFVLRGSSAEEDHTPADVSIIIEGTEVLDDCRYVAKACLLCLCNELKLPTKDEIHIRSVSEALSGAGCPEDLSQSTVSTQHCQGPSSLSCLPFPFVCLPCLCPFCVCVVCIRQSLFVPQCPESPLPVKAPRHQGCCNHCSSTTPVPVHAPGADCHSPYIRERSAFSPCQIIVSAT